MASPLEKETLPEEAGKETANRMPMRTISKTKDADYGTRGSSDEAINAAMRNDDKYFSNKYQGYALDYSLERDQLNPMLYDFLQECDFNNRGSLSPEDLDQMSDVVKITCKAAENNTAQLNYKHLPECVKNVMLKFDFSGKGHVSVEDLSRAAELWDQNQKQGKLLMKIVLGLIACLILLAGATFGTTIFAIDLTKEIEAGDNGIIMTTSGGMAKTGDPEFQNALASTTPDHILHELKKLKISDGSMSLELRIVGFSRVIAPSKCGSLVHLEAPHGMIVVDDTDIHFDEGLSSYLGQRGIAVDEVSAFGRRLSSAASLNGFFSFWEEYQWECSGIQKPVSPQKPHIMKILRKHPCASYKECASKVDPAGPLAYHSLPGYDVDTNTIITQETVISTDDFDMSVIEMPNHPGQQLVTVTDHVSKTHWSKQIYEDAIQTEDQAFHCKSMKYADAVENATNNMFDKYFASFIASGPMEAQDLELPWGSVNVPARTLRHFRMVPTESGEDAEAIPLTIDYYDDVKTLEPMRMYFNDARKLELDTQEILVLTSDGGASASAAGATLRKELDIPCATEAELGLPVMTSPFEEDIANVKYYVNAMIRDAAKITTSYWLNAIQAPSLNGTATEDARRLESDDQPLLNKRLNSEDRALLNRRLAPQGSFKVWETIVDIDLGNAKFKFERGIELTTGMPCVVGALQGGECLPTGSWKTIGTFQVGACLPPWSALSVTGRGELHWCWGFEMKFTLVEAKCELGIFGYIMGTTGSYGYNCRRRLAEEGAGNAAGIKEDTDNSRRLLTWRQDHNELPAGEGDEAEELTEDAEELSEDARDLLSRRLAGRRRRRRRRRVCHRAGFHVQAGVGLAGGCELCWKKCGKGIGATIKGGLNIVVGPWPSPLVARLKGTIGAEACAKFGVIKVCVGVVGITLFDKQLYSSVTRVA